MIRSLAVATLLALGAGALAGACVIGGRGHYSYNGIRVDEEARRVQSLPLELSSADTLTLDSGFGDVEVRASDDGESRIVATIVARARTAEEALELLRRYEVQVERGPEGPVARLVGEPLVVHQGSRHVELAAHVDYTAYVPTATALAVTAGSGDIRLRGALGAARLNAGFGEVSVDEVRGDLSVESGSGDVRVGRANGDAVALHSGFGAVRLDAAEARRITCKSGSGDVTLANARAEEIELTTDFGSVHARDTSGSLLARSGSGELSLHDVRGGVTATSDFGSIELDGELAGLLVEAGSGSVVVRARSGSDPAAGWQLASDFGDVALHVPAGFACHLSARTDFGDATSDFPVTIEAARKKRDGELHGTVGGGGGTVRLTSGSGDVRLRKL